MQITSERLLLKEIAQGDFEAVYAVLSNEQVMRYAYVERYAHEAMLRARFEEMVRGNAADKERPAYEYLVYEKQGGALVGLADILVDMRNDAGGYGDIGVFLLPEYWGKGYAVELLHRLFDVGFDDAGLHRLTACCHQNNAQSERIMQKAGMVREGVARKARYKDGGWWDEKSYSLLCEEWQEKRSE